MCFEKPCKTKKNARMTPTARKKSALNRTIEQFVVDDTLSWMACELAEKNRLEASLISV